MSPNQLTQTPHRRTRQPMISPQDLQRHRDKDAEQQASFQLLSALANAARVLTIFDKFSQTVATSTTNAAINNTHTTPPDFWLYKLQNTPTRSDEIKGLDTVVNKVDDALRAGRFEQVNRWIDTAQRLDLAPLIAIGLFRFSTAARRKHPNRFPAWNKALQTLHKKLKTLGLDADHKLRGLLDP